MTTENTKNDPENRDPTCNDHNDLQSTDQAVFERETTATQAHEASCPVCQAGHAKHCTERDLYAEIDDLRAELHELRCSDWLGLLTLQPNFGDNGAHTWADTIADYLGLQGTDDAQALYLKLVERDGELRAAERRADEAEREVRRLKLESGLGKVAELEHRLRLAKDELHEARRQGFASTQQVRMVRKAPRDFYDTKGWGEQPAERIRVELAHGRLALEHLGESGSTRCVPWAVQQAAVWCPLRERRGVWLDVAQLWVLAELKQRVGEQPKWRAVYDEAEQLVLQALLAAEGHLRAVEG